MAKFVAHHVGRVLGPTEPGLDQREAGLHEDHEDGADDDPQQVDLLRRGRDRCRVGVLGKRRGPEGHGEHAGEPECHEDLAPHQPVSSLVRDKAPYLVMVDGSFPSSLSPAPLTDRFSVNPWRPYEESVTSRCHTREAFGTSS